MKRAYGEALTPFGLLAAGRMGSTWGLGMLANGGDCADCNCGDAADRIAFITPLAGHICALAYDFNQIGPFVASSRRQHRRSTSSPSADVHTVTFALPPLQGRRCRASAAASPARRPSSTARTSRTAGRTNDVPGDLPARPRSPSPSPASQVMARGYQATAVDGWARVTHPLVPHRGRVGALLVGVDQQASLIPGVLYHEPVTAQQIGARARERVRRAGVALRRGARRRLRERRPSPGFGAFPVVGAPPAQPGDLNGPKANPPTHTTVNNFRFHPDYLVDRILFREIIGTVTGAVYAPPARALGRHAHRAPAPSRRSVAGDRLVRRLRRERRRAGRRRSASRSTPRSPTRSRDGFGVALEYAVLFPLAGLDNPLAQPQRLSRPSSARVRVMYMF